MHNSRVGKRPANGFCFRTKLSAIDSVRNGHTKASISRKFGIPESTLRGWCKSEDKIRDLVNLSETINSTPNLPGPLGAGPIVRASSDKDDDLSGPRILKRQKLADGWSISSSTHVGAQRNGESPTNSPPAASEAPATPTPARTRYNEYPNKVVEEQRQTSWQTSEKESSSTPGNVTSNTTSGTAEQATLQWLNAQLQLLGYQPSVPFSTASSAENSSGLWYWYASLMSMMSTNNLVTSPSPAGQQQRSTSTTLLI